METVDSIKEKLGVAEDKDLADLLGMGASAVSNWRTSGKLSAPAERLARQILHERGYNEKTPSGFTLIPLYDVQASAGGGALVGEEQVIDQLAFKEDWIRHVLRVNPKDLALISTTGDSMEPTLHPGDIIMLDRSVRSITNNAVYAIQVNGTLMVKRIQRMVDGRVIIRSDNVIYEAETISSDLVEGLKIVGRVVWAGRQF